VLGFYCVVFILVVDSCSSRGWPFDCCFGCFGSVIGV
jgi:hypothetical protein